MAEAHTLVTTGQMEGGWAPSLHRGELPAAPCIRGVTMGDGGLCFHSLETIQTGSELGGSSHFRGPERPTQPRRRRWRELWGNLSLSGQGGQSQTQLPQSGTPSLGPWPPLTTPLQPGQLDLPLPESPLAGEGGEGGHLMPLEPPRKQRCLCVPG